MGTVTIATNTYDIYGTVADADVYLAARIGADSWTMATADIKAQALVTGTRLIRTWLAAQGYDVDPASAVDVEIENANYELAYALLVNPGLQDQPRQSSGNRKRVKAGSAEVEYFRPDSGSRFSSAVQSLLAVWIATQNGLAGSGDPGAPLASGTCNPPPVGPCDYRLIEGY